MKTRMSLWRSLTFALLYTLLAISMQTKAIAEPVIFFFQDLEAEISPFDVTLDGQTFNTGPIQVSLDPRKPRSDQYVLVDTQDMSLSSQVDLLVTSPLLEALEQPAQEFRLTETGPITDIILSETGDIESLSFSLSGGGEFGSGQFLEGWRYVNGKGGSAAAIVVGLLYAVVWISESEVIDIDNKIFQVVDEGAATIIRHDVPEPPSLLLFLLGLAPMGLMVTKFKKGTTAAKRGAAVRREPSGRRKKTAQ